jgi:predicted RNA-binding protein with PUA-like domain
VRNFQARNNLRAMKKWDLCFWYHSNEGKEIVWIACVSKEAYPDPTAIWEKWDRVVVELIPHKKLEIPITLDDIKVDKNLQSMSLLKQQRLSVAPVSKQEYAYIMNRTKTI